MATQGRNEGPWYPGKNVEKQRALYEIFVVPFWIKQQVFLGFGPKM